MKNQKLFSLIQPTMLLGMNGLALVIYWLGAALVNQISVGDPAVAADDVQQCTGLQHLCHIRRHVLYDAGHDLYAAAPGAGLCQNESMRSWTGAPPLPRARGDRDGAGQRRIPGRRPFRYPRRGGKWSLPYQLPGRARARRSRSSAPLAAARRPWSSLGRPVL